jgi:DNA-binding MarR family transcriptional regulator
MTSIERELKQSRPFASKAEAVAVALLRTADAVRRNIALILAPHDLTPQQYNVLRILRGAGERGLPTLDIVDRLIEETPGITRLIDRLEAKKLVRRERCLTDRRQVFCRITKEGLDLLDALDEPLAAALEQSMTFLKRRDLIALDTYLNMAREGFNLNLERLRR